MRVSAVVVGYSLLGACAVSNEPPPPKLAESSGKDMLSGGGCFIKSCVAKQASLRLPCVSASPSTLANSLKIRVNWHVERVKREKIFDVASPIGDAPVSLVETLPSSCDSEVDRITLTAQAAGPDSKNPRLVMDIVNAECLSEPRCRE